MKILFDTNVLISAFITSGSSYDTVQDAVYSHQVYYTDHILREFKSLFKTKFHFDEKLIAEFERFIRKFFQKGLSSETKDAVCGDPDDDQILADSIVNGIEIVITGDKDLLRLKEHKGIKIINPSAYWQT